MYTTSSVEILTQITTVLTIINIDELSMIDTSISPNYTLTNTVQMIFTQSSTLLAIFNTVTTDSSTQAVVSISQLILILHCVIL